MAGDPLPIVFTERPRNKLIVLAIGTVLMGIGIMMIFDQAGGLVGGAGPFRRGVLPSEVGWMVCGIGLVLTVLALLQLARDCPRLELNDEGILYSRCLQATRIAWNELDRAEIQRNSVARPIGAVLDSLMLVTTDGRKVVISAPIAPAQVAQLRETITRVAGVPDLRARCVDRSDRAFVSCGPARRARRGGFARKAGRRGGVPALPARSGGRTRTGMGCRIALHSWRALEPQKSSKRNCDSISTP